jgi:hypothetical protein
MLGYRLKAGWYIPFTLLIKHHINSDEKDKNISQYFFFFCLLSGGRQIFLNMHAMQLI